MAGVENVIISTQIERDLDPAWVAQEITREIIDPLVPMALRTPTFKLWVNPAGPFEIGGPNGDTGLTGRKIIVDTYGGSCPHGGGAFSGKDPTKVDRSAAYMARYIAKNLVAAGYARRCLVQLAYAIGVAEPVSLLIDTYGTGTVPDEKLEDMVRSTFKLTPRGIIESLDCGAHLSEDRRLWTFWPGRAGVHLGTRRSGGEAGRVCRVARVFRAHVLRQDGSRLKGGKPGKLRLSIERASRL